MAQNRSSQQSKNQPRKTIESLPKFPNVPRNDNQILRSNNIPGTVVRIAYYLTTFRPSTITLPVFSYVYTHHNSTTPKYYFCCGCSCTEYMFNSSCFGGRNVHIQPAQVLQSKRKIFRTTCMRPISTHTHNQCPSLQTSTHSKQ